MRYTTALILTVCLAPLARADGMLDPGFGNGGRVVTNFPPFGSERVLALALQPDGRAVAVGSNMANLSQTFMVAARYLPSGELDTSFDGDGLVTVTFFGTGPDPTSMARTVLLQPDGKIVLVGFFSDSPTANYALARLNANGSLDATFGTAGQTVTPVAGGGIDAGTTALLQADGKILVSGVVGSAAAPGLALARYNANGTLDGSFGTAGQATVALPGTFRASAMTLQPDGKILIAGQNALFNIALVRLLPTGAPDPLFDGDGYASADFAGAEVATSLVLLPDGRIVVGGHRTTPVQDMVLVRFLATGALDTTFGTAGLALGDSGVREFADTVVLQPNGKLMAAGWTDDTGAQDFILARFEAGGTVDTTFGTNGFLRVDFGGAWDEGHDVLIAGPDRLLVAGFTTSGLQDFALARIIATTPVEALSFSVE